ncbi:MAG: SCP2 sterol-binding domain-containing protein [Polyangiales bacterium]
MQRPETTTPSAPGDDGAPRRFDDHPTVRLLRSRPRPPAPLALTRGAIVDAAIGAGADDAGAVSIDHPDLAEEREHVERALPGVRTLVSLVMRTHADNIKSPSRSVANAEFHRVGHALDEVAARVTGALSSAGHRTINPAMAFPMEMAQFPGRTWVVSHKRVAVAAQLGRMGLHRNVIHPRFGSFVLLATVLTTAELEGAAEPLGFDPCVGCKLCVAACPVGAIEPSGAFRFSACYDHNYREFMTGFGDLLEAVAESDDRHALRERVSISETASMWQSLAYQPNYKAAYCVAVCPAGEDVLGPYLGDRRAHLDAVVRPLTEREEDVYVVEGSDAQAHVAKRFPRKRVRVVRSSLRASDARGFFRALPLIFQRGAAKGWSATFHFALSGDAPTTATVRIDDGTLRVTEGLEGDFDVRVEADARAWLDVVSGKRNAVAAVLTRRLRVRGDRSLLQRFARCFPR